MCCGVGVWLLRSEIEVEGGEVRIQKTEVRRQKKNPKYEYLNPKQIQNHDVRRFKT